MSHISTNSTTMSHALPPTDEYYNLGTYTRPISTNNQATQTWFDRGLIWSYAFNHGEAYKCFEQAVAHDSNCAIAYWGMAYAAGPNYNKAWRMFDAADLQQSTKICYEALSRASRLLETGSSTPIERALIAALSTRYPTAQPATDYEQIDIAYSNAMEKVYHKFITDLDIAALYIDAKMHTAQRKMFDKQTGLPIDSSPVHEVIHLLEKALNLPNAQSHPGLLHFCIHFWEMSATPANALPSANHLRGLVPDAGHLNHMPTHIDILLGDYQNAIDSNTAAVTADEKYLLRNGAKNMYSFYRFHNYHSLIYAAMLSGQSNVALDAVDRMEVSITDDVLSVESPPLADWLEFFKSVRVHVYIRFGMWDALISLPLPTNQTLYSVTTTMTHYGKGIAYAATNNLAQADIHRTLYHTTAQRIPPSRMDYPNRITEILKVATAMLDGEIAYRRGDMQNAFEHLRSAIRADDALLYTEPWGWMLPTRHAYAALALEQGMVEGAARAYAEDLGVEAVLSRAHQHPGNVWALHGYRECLGKLGRDDEAGLIKEQLDEALRMADVEITASCFCRLGVDGGRDGGCC